MQLKGTFWKYIFQCLLRRDAYWFRIKFIRCGEQTLCSSNQNCPPPPQNNFTNRKRKVYPWSVCQWKILSFTLDSLRLFSPLSSRAAWISLIGNIKKLFSFHVLNSRRLYSKQRKFPEWKHSWAHSISKCHYLVKAVTNANILRGAYRIQPRRN